MSLYGEAVAQEDISGRVVINLITVNPLFTKNGRVQIQRWKSPFRKLRDGRVNKINRF